jgi:hypothetical protein
VHALDTVAVAAHCIDLAELTGRDDLLTLRLRLRGGTLSVVKASRLLLLIDRTTFRVSEPGKAPAPTSGKWPWLPIGAAGSGLLILAGAASLLARRRRLAPT